MSALLSAVALPALSIPSPSVSYLQLGPFRVHFYALCILTGMAVCLWLGARRWKAMGGTGERVFDVAMWAIPAGIVGARAYHVLITDPGSYGCRRYGMNFPAFADAVAPGILLAQAFGRWGNWFNQELFGKPTTLPWGLEISTSSGNFPSQYPAGTLFHPTFLYESLWNLLGVALLLWLSRKGVLKLGQTLWLYVFYYGVGRLFIEMFLRIDTSEMLWGVRIHVWTALLLVLLGAAGFVVAGRRAAAKAAAGVEPGPVEVAPKRSEKKADDAEDSASAEDSDDSEGKSEATEKAEKAGKSEDTASS